MAKASSERGFRIAYIVDERLLLDCERLLMDLRDKNPPTLPSMDKPPVTFEVDCGSTTFTLHTAQEVTNLSNAGAQKITGLRIRTPYFDDTTVSIRFNRIADSECVRYSVAGEHAKLLELENRLEGILLRSRQSYSRIAHIDIIGLFITILMAASILSLVAVAVYYISGPRSDEPLTARGQTYGMLIGYCLLAFALISGTLLGRVRGWLFPVGIFAVGNDHDRAHKLELWRWFLGGSVIVALIINLATGLILR